MKDGFNKGVDKIMMRGKCTDADFELIKKHNRYRAIDFWDCKLTNLDCVLPLKKLETYCQYGGSIDEYAALMHVSALKEVFLNSIDQYGDLSFVKPLTQLKKLQVLYLKKLEAFPDLSANTALTTIRIWDCKRLADISTLANIPNLESVDILGTPHTPADLEFLVKLDNIKSINATFGTVKENGLMDELLQHYGKTKHG